MNLAVPFIIHPANDLLEKHPAVKALAAQITAAYSRHEVVSSDALQRMGEVLWQALDVAIDFDVQLKKAGMKVLPIVIASDNPAIAKLPWELLYHPKYQYLGTSKRFTLSRKILDDSQPDAQSSTALTDHLAKGPLRVLLFTSLPDYPQHEFIKAQRLNIEEEQAQVLEALLPLMREGKVKLEMPDDGRFETLRDTITQTSPHVVFLSGHGSYQQSLVSDEPAQAVFEFEDIDGTAKSMAAEEMMEAFAGSDVRCLVVSACESGKQQSNVNDGLIQQLAQLGIAHVVGMSESIFDVVGHYFARQFCQAIGTGSLVSTALQQARQSIAEMQQLPEHILDKTAALEVFRSQWHFPLLYSEHCDQPLIDWNFEPKPETFEQLNIQLHHVTHHLTHHLKQPKRFIGRRMELRTVQSQIKAGQHQWLFIGPGGQGKTALAGKIAHNLHLQGHQVFAWSAKQHEQMHSFISELQNKLVGEFAKAYDNAFGASSEYDRALLLLQQLCRQYRSQGSNQAVNSKVVLFLDNLESLQDEQNYQLNSEQVKAWIKAAQALSQDGLVLLLTSRWKMPDWSQANCVQLGELHYHDFILLAQTSNCPTWLLKQTGKLRQLHQTLHGNGRGLEFFLAAINHMSEDEASEFENQLQNAKQELQTNMALGVIVQHLDENDKIILHRMTVYQSPVPQFAVLKLVDALAGVTMEKQTALTSLNRLVNCSLLEQHYHDETEYLCSPVVADWLYSDSNVYFDGGRCVPLADEILITAAEQQQQLFTSSKPSFEQALVVYKAYLTTTQKDTAYRFAYDKIIGRLEMAGLYQSLLDNWMPELQKAQDPKLQGQVIGRIGKLYSNISDFDTALDYLKQSLLITQEVGDKRGESAVLCNMASIFRARGDYDKALEYLNKDLQITQEIDDKQGEGTTLNNISQIYDARGDFDTALDYLKQSLAIMQEIGDKQGKGATLNNISQIFQVRGDFDAALNYLKQSLAIMQEIGDKQGEGATLNNIYAIYHARGDFDTALDYLKQSLAIVQEIGDKQGEGATLNNISLIFKARGDFDTALDYLKQSLAIGQEIGDKQGEGTTLNNICGIYHARGDFDTALDYLKQSLAIRQEIGDKQGEGATLNNISQIFKARGDFDTALNHLKQSLAIRQEIGDKQGESVTLGNIATIYHARGDFDTALDYLKQSLAISQEIGDKAGLCATLFNMGHIHFANDEKQQAFSAWLTVYSIAKPAGIAQALQALEGLAEQIGLANGLEGWEGLYQQALANRQDGE